MTFRVVLYRGRLYLRHRNGCDYLRGTSGRLVTFPTLTAAYAAALSHR